MQQQQTTNPRVQLCLTNYVVIIYNIYRCEITIDRTERKEQNGRKTQTNTNTHTQNTIDNKKSQLNAYKLLLMLLEYKKER